MAVNGGHDANPVVGNGQILPVHHLGDAVIEQHGGEDDAQDVLDHQEHPLALSLQGVFNDGDLDVLVVEQDLHRADDDHPDHAVPGGLVGPHKAGAENIPGLKGLKFSDIGDKFNLPTKTANDASMAALGEAKYGSGKEKDYQSVMFVTLGTGVGGGFVLNGKLFTGSLGGAGEIGHVFVVPDGDKCNCGSSGCIERYASATGFIAMAKQKIHKGVIPTTLTYEELDKGKAKALFDAAKKGDILAKETIAECSYYLGMSIAQALNMLDLDLVLIGGGLCKDFDMMIEHINRAVRNYGLRMMVGNLEIKPASLGNDAGVLGCAALFFRNN